MNENRGFCSLKAIDEMGGGANVHKKFGNMKCQRVKVDESFGPTLEDEAIEVQHLLTEPKPDNVSVDGVLCFGKEKFWNCSIVEELSYGLDYGQKRNWGGRSSSNTQAQDGFEFGGLDGLLDDVDGLLDEVDEVDDIHAANDISGACEDFLLDIELPETVSDLDCTPLEALPVRNLSSETESPGFSGSSSGALGLSESSMETIRESECKNCSLEKMAKCELHVLSEDKFDCLTPADGNKYATEHVFENLDGLENDAMAPLSGMSCDDNEGKVMKASKVGTRLRQKRFRKPTKRYIEEFSDLKSKRATESEKVPSAASKYKQSKISSHNEEHHVRPFAYAAKFTEETSDDIEDLDDIKIKHLIKRPKISSAASKCNSLKIIFGKEGHHVKVLKPAAMEEPLTGISTGAPSESWLRRGRPRKCKTLRPVLKSDDELTESECERFKIRAKRGHDRRKHQHIWTLSEVVKLVDGIAQFGTGRWTDIKNQLFSSTTYRTPIDLRDKWRNLLRVSCANKPNKKEVAQKPNHEEGAQEPNDEEVEQKSKHHPLPKSVLRRIHELASLHPYPRFSPGGRYSHRKN